MHPDLNIKDLSKFIDTALASDVTRDKLNPDVLSFPTEDTVLILAKDQTFLSEQLNNSPVLLKNMLQLLNNIIQVTKEYGLELRRGIISSMKEIFVMHSNSLAKKPRLVGATNFDLAVNIIIDPNKAMSELKIAVDKAMEDLANFKITGEIDNKYKTIF